ncbi:MAG: class I SAM-dependent methyltransferase [Verrucomicrobia bacterium]|nr:class I SAM-dependent methyltransferase [Verrucomicrobiota bacterium]
MHESFDPDSAAAWQVRLFKKSVTRQAVLRNLQRLLSPVDNKTCLDVGGDHGVIPWMLRKNGGIWVSVDADETSVADMRVILGEDQVYQIEGAELPFEDQSFDTLVVIHYLESIRDDAAFIRECHRCLKPKGELIFCVHHIKSYSTARGLGRLLGIHSRRKVRPGYTQRDLYEIIKDGFDMVETVTFGGTLTACLDKILEKSTGETLSRGYRINEEGMITDAQQLRRFAKAVNLHAVLYPLQKIAAGIDRIFSFTNDHYIVVKARPRPWIQRKSVKLKDGRSIAEAAIRTKIGTAIDHIKPLPGT